MRNIEDWNEKFKSLPFERIQEKYREIKSIEVLNRTTSEKQPSRILEIGPGFSSICPDLFPSQEVVLIEPASTLYEYNKDRFFNCSNVTVLKKTIMNFTQNPKPVAFDLIVMNGVVHELDNPRVELSKLMQVLEPHGNIVISVPNNQSVHRLMGVALGILPLPESRTNMENILQQNHNFSPRTLTDLIVDLGLSVELLETSFVKPNTHSKMQEWVDGGVLREKDLDSLFELSKIFDPFGSEIFIAAKPAIPKTWAQ
jgi:trans-aconitate methyltransferase